MKIIMPIARSLAILVMALGVAGCSASAADLSKPVTLVATANLAGDRLFAQTVLVAAPLPNGMHVGMIVNRPSKVPLARLFPQHAPSRNVVEPVYVGGPMMVDLVYAVVRTPPEDTANVLALMPNLVLVLDGQVIDRIIETTPNEARYFAGLVVWRPGELDEEIRAGAWQVNPADASTVFSSHPEELWKTLSRKGPELITRSASSTPIA